MIILFSRSGLTAKRLLDQISFSRDITLLSNNNKDIDLSLLSEYPVVILSHREIEEYLLKESPTKVLLMGYLRILSSEVCKRHQIFNIHPGNIIKHPELKGKDPVERAFADNKYKDIGVVLHKVIAEVDEGEILFWEVFRKPKTIELAYKKIEEIAVNLWKKLLD